MKTIQFAVGLGVVDAALDMLDPILGQVGFELADALLASFAFVGVEL